MQRPCLPLTIYFAICCWPDYVTIGVNNDLAYDWSNIEKMMLQKDEG